MTPEDLPGHTYLNEHHSDWSKGLPTITAQGGPWGCATCNSASMLPYRCSICGADLAGDGSGAQ